MNRRAAAAGAAAATVWALLERVDMSLLGCDYSDVALLGKAVSKRHWRPVGLVLHAANGAAFGLGWARLSERRRVSPVAVALAENAAFWPLTSLIDRYHPARGEPGVPPLLHNRRAFVQATWRHSLFGWLLGRLARSG